MTDDEGYTDVESDLAFIERVSQARGLWADVDAMDRVRRMLQGKLTRDQARAEIAAKYGLPLPSESHPA